MTVLILISTILVAVPPNPSIQWASIGVIFIFLFVFGYAWQGCVWLYGSEIAPLEYRHIGGAATATGEWLMTFITVFAGPSMYLPGNLSHSFLKYYSLKRECISQLARLDLPCLRSYAE